LSLLECLSIDQPWHIGSITENVSHSAGIPLAAPPGGHLISIERPGNFAQSSVSIWVAKLGKDSPHYGRLINIAP
jgi:hypothetical protein